MNSIKEFAKGYIFALGVYTVGSLFALGLYTAAVWLVR